MWLASHDCNRFLWHSVWHTTWTSTFGFPVNLNYYGCCCCWWCYQYQSWLPWWVVWEYTASWQMINDRRKWKKRVWQPCSESPRNGQSIYDRKMQKTTHVNDNDPFWTGVCRCGLPIMILMRVRCYHYASMSGTSRARRPNFFMATAFVLWPGLLNLIFYCKKCTRSAWQPTCARLTT